MPAAKCQLHKQIADITDLMERDCREGGDLRCMHLMPVGCVDYDDDNSS